MRDKRAAKAETLRRKQIRAGKYTTTALTLVATL